MTAGEDRIEDLRDRLESISEELADIALDELREAAEKGATRTTEREKRLTRARRAVEKASMLLAEA